MSQTMADSPESGSQTMADSPESEIPPSLYDKESFSKQYHGGSGSVLNYADIESAEESIRKEPNGIPRTPLKESPLFSQQMKMTLYFKMDSQLRTGSFKERGARNKLYNILQNEGPATVETQGVVAASAGNHGIALAYHGQLLGIPVTIVTPQLAPITKVSQCKSYGAEVITEGEDILQAKRKADELCAANGFIYVNGYNDMEVLAGQGTAALEILDELNGQLDAVVIPVGGGGLLAGMATVFKHKAPHVKVIAVESEQCPSFTAAMKAGKPVRVNPKPSLADGLSVPEVGDNAFATAFNKVDYVCVVEEKWIDLAILQFVEREKRVVEGAGAAGLAACLSGRLDGLLQGKTVVVMLCGENIDTAVLIQSLERGLALDGRPYRCAGNLK